MHNHCLLYIVYDYYLLNVDYTTSEFQSSMHLKHAAKYSNICQGCASTKLSSPQDPKPKYTPGLA